MDVLMVCLCVISLVTISYMMYEVASIFDNAFKPLTPLTSDQRIIQIERLINNGSIQDSGAMWELVRVELHWLDKKIQSDKSFSLNRYFSKNIVIQKLMNSQIQCDRMIDEILRT